MSSRRARNAANGARITGPQSALTDFLAANNISARQIATQAQERRQAAERAEIAENADREVAEALEDGRSLTEQESDARFESITFRTPESEILEAIKRARERRSLSILKEARHGDRNAKRKRDELEKKPSSKVEKQKLDAIKKTKKSQEFKKRRKGKGYKSDDAEDASDDAWELFKESKKVPGQLEHCEVCGKRFTVTGYTKAGSKGGLLCKDCSKDIDKEEKENKPKKAAVNRRKRQQENKKMEGLKLTGAKTLIQLCIDTISKNIHDVEELGDIAPNLVDGLSKRLSKSRILDTNTLDLFLRNDYDTVSLYDCAKLSKDDFIRIFMLVPHLKRLKLVNANQFKSEAMGYIIDKKIRLEKVDLLGANLVDEELWETFFKLQSTSLKTLKLSWIDGKFTPKNIKTMVKHCSEISHLSLRRIWETMNEDSLKELGKLKKVTSLSLEFNKDIGAQPLVDLVNSCGPNLSKLSLKTIPEADDDLLETIHDKCIHLTKLALTDNDTMTDAGFVSLFSNWKNSPLTSINLSSCRDVDANRPKDNVHGIGLCSDGFTALMDHSGSRLEVLNIASDRHVSHAAFLKVFDGVKKYEKLRIVDVSFVPSLDDVAINGLFQSAPNLQKVLVFGVFGVVRPKIPSTVVVLGMPNAALVEAEEGGVLASL